MTLDLTEASVRAADGRSPPATEAVLAGLLADVAGLERVSVDSHFFDDLGVDSMVMAQFCARVRKRGDMPPVSIRDVYRHPTIRGLATSLADAATPASAQPTPPAPAETTTPSPAWQHVLCGALQLLAFLGYAFLAALAITRGYEWIAAGSGPIDVYLRSTLVGGASFVGACAVPILAKWTLIGRWEPQRIRIWSLAYVRFWIVKTLVRTSPLVLFAGSPLYVLYLRSLGAKVGRGAVILSRHVPICTDLLTIGEGTVIRKDSFFTCYRARGGVIETGTVTLGRDAFVGEATVLDIDTSMGDGAQLGHSSSIQAGQVVPAGECRHGSPAQRRSEVDYRAVEPARCATPRRAVYAILQLLAVLALYVPLAMGGLHLLIGEIPQMPGLHGPLLASLSIFLALALAALLFVVTVPRVLNLTITPGKAYPLYGFHYAVHRLIARTTNLPFFTYLFGDSIAIVQFLRALGYDLSAVEQTGSNFGMEVKHETPFFSSVGSGTMAADGLSIINADFSSTSFRVSPVTIGARNFLGNYVAYPSQARTGENCLLATKVMVPVDGEVREGVGLLGSPCFEIPRSVLRDSRFDHLRSGDEFRRRLAAKTRHNAVTIGLFLLVQWIHLFGLTALAWGAAGTYESMGAAAIALAGALGLLFSVVYFALVERAATGLRALRPQYCSIYQPYFWWHERYWKLATQPRILDGTPFKSLAWRLLGVRIGKRVFDDGCVIQEKTLVRIGDDCALNFGSFIQPHSQEDATFKSERITLGAGCTIGTGALVHYGVTLGDGVELAPDSFLMKGEEVPPQARWGGNPARDLRDEASAVRGDESYLTAA
jgi:non-ribosomal peptide synthetase-like protein